MRLRAARGLAGRALVALGLGAAGCGGEARPWAAYEEPKRRPAPADPSCEGLARSQPGGRWVEGAMRLRVEAGSRLEIADAGVLGGPYEEPIALEVPEGTYALDLVTGEAPGGAGRALCARLRLGPAAAASWRELGDVVLDTDVLVIADGAAYRRTLGPRTGALYAALEADAPAIESLRPELARRGLPLVPIVPTLARASRPLAPGDERLVRDVAAGARGGRARFLVEPASPGWDVLSRLGDGDRAEITFAPGGPPVAVAVEAGRGSGAYAVAAGYGAGGELAALEVRLAP
ncbi:MAG TPA: hypothetical protein VFS43_28970 [Polyangiaceae bacterium]|nr:hypothetical protein [Polyangiaceae bacterium]